MSKPIELFAGEDLEEGDEVLIIHGRAYHPCIWEPTHMAFTSAKIGYKIELVACEDLQQ
jgi:hypothetical protein